MKTSIDRHSEKFEQALQRYVHAYMNERDPEKIQELLADQFCGFGTGGDEYFTDQAMYQAKKSGKDRVNLLS